MTIKTKAELATLFADNTTGAISPQDLRDLVDSMEVYGSIIVTAGATGQTIASGVPELMTEWTANGESNGASPDYTTDKITIDNAGMYEIHFFCSFMGITNCIFEFELRVDGVASGVSCLRKTGNTDVGSTTFTAHVDLAAGEELSVWVEGDQNGTFTAEECGLVARRIL